MSNITPPSSAKIDQLDLSSPTLFDILLVDESGVHGQILASGSGFRAEGDSNNDSKSSLLPVIARPLGQLTWKVEMDTGMESKPELILNSEIPDAISKIRNDPHFQALILPAALREILIYFLWDDDDIEDNEVRKYWMEFGTILGGEIPVTKDASELFTWVDKVVDGFCERFSLCDLLRSDIEDSQYES